VADQVDWRFEVALILRMRPGTASGRFPRFDGPTSISMHA
jgi:hypothetical protein